MHRAPRSCLSKGRFGPTLWRRMRRRLRCRANTPRAWISKISGVLELRPDRVRLQKRERADIFEKSRAGATRRPYLAARLAADFLASLTLSLAFLTFFLYSEPMSSSMAIGAPSPGRGASLTMRV